MACGSLHISLVSNTREMSRAVHQRQTVLDSLLEGAALQMPLHSLANQSSALPSHATTIAKADFPNDGLLRPQGPHMGCFGVWKEPWIHIHTYSHPAQQQQQPPWRNGNLLAGHPCQCISHRRTWVKSEPDKSRVLSGLCPACSCHL